MVELSPAAAAAEIVALINSRVSSPRQEELEAIIAKVTTRKPLPSALTGQQRETWRRLVAAHDAAHAVSGNLKGDDPREPAAMAVSAAADAQLEAFHEKLWASPSGDVRLLAEICFRRHWPGCDLTEADSDRLMEEGPSCDCDKALAALLRAIRDFVISSGSVVFDS